MQKLKILFRNQFKLSDQFIFQPYNWFTLSLAYGFLLKSSKISMTLDLFNVYIQDNLDIFSSLLT